jgi:hypothetical protein
MPARVAYGQPAKGSFAPILTANGENGSKRGLVGWEKRAIMKADEGNGGLRWLSWGTGFCRRGHWACDGGGQMHKNGHEILPPPRVFVFRNWQQEQDSTLRPSGYESDGLCLTACRQIAFSTLVRQWFVSVVPFRATPCRSVD